MDKIFPDLTLTETEFFEVNQDWEVPITGFFIIAAKKERRSFGEFTDKEAEEFIFLLRKVRRAMKQVLDIDQVYLFQNEGSEHNFHVWLFPQHDWMEKFETGIKSVKPIIKHAKEKMKNKREEKERSQEKCK